MIQATASEDHLKTLYSAYATAYAYLASEPSRKAEALEEVERPQGAPSLGDLTNLPLGGLVAYRYPDKESATSAGRRFHTYSNRYIRGGGECVRFIKEKSLVEGYLLFAIRLPL